MLISIALFVLAATVSLRVVGDGLRSVERMHLDAVALDLARSRLAELEAGVVTLADLRVPGTALRTVGTVTWDDPADRLLFADRRWTLRASWTAAPFDGFSLVELEVRLGDDPARPESYAVVRRLLRLRDVPESSYEADDLLDGIPEEVVEDPLPSFPAAGVGPR